MVVHPIFNKVAGNGFVQGLGVVSVGEELGSKLNLSFFSDELLEIVEHKDLVSVVVGIFFLNNFLNLLNCLRKGVDPPHKHIILQHNHITVL
jgi:hypothetical protein